MSASRKDPAPPAIERPGMLIEDYGVVGDLHSMALIARDGSVDWLCFPRFDSSACFAALLGSANNGSWQMSPRSGTASCRYRRQYRPNTLVLETEMATAEGVVRVIDFMPPDGPFRHLIRIVEGVEGEVPMETRVVIRFDYGRTVPWVRHLKEGGVEAIAGPNALMVRTTVPLRGEELSTVGRFALRPGERVAFVLTHYLSYDDPPPAVDAMKELEATMEFWTGWSERCTYRGPRREAVIRSLITLKALTYAPTGGIVAAGTTSLPEFIGGVRNWDYRYCWLRDATFTLYSFMRAGYIEEAKAWSEWLLRAAAGDPSQLQIMYGVAGERSLPELELKHLSGYEGSKPVRVGNAAADQFQLDVYGEVMDAMHLARSVGLKTDSDSWHLQRHLVEYVAEHWDEPDEGIWEVRGPRQHFVHSKVMAWVAMDRAVKAVEQFGLEGDAPRWSVVRDEIHAEVCARGFDESMPAFTQYYGSGTVDASVLMMPLVGFLPATDPRVMATVDCIQNRLDNEGLVQRYLHIAGVDGLPPGEGTFLPCSFWLVDCLYLGGRKKEAAEMFDRLLSLRNDLGLLAEEYDPRARRQLGNVPQAFSHICLVNTALNLSPRDVGPAEERSSQ